MPAALALDWTAIQTSAIEIGIAETIRQMGLEQHADAVYQRSKREGWLVSIPRNQPLPPSVSKPVSIVRSAPQAVIAAMREGVLEGRASGIRIHRRAMNRLERMDDDELVQPETTDVFVKQVKAGAVLGGYNAGESVARVSLTLAGAAPGSQVQAPDPAWIDGDFEVGPG